MKTALCRILVVAAVLLGTSTSGHTDGGYRGGGGAVYHGGGGVSHGGWGVTSYRGGVWVGPGWGGWGAWGPGWGVWGPGWWWPPAYPYYAPPVVIEQSPQFYVQPSPQPEEQTYWYYCPDPQGYYPYVNRCPKGWLKVVPSPAPPEKGE